MKSVYYDSVHRSEVPPYLLVSMKNSLTIFDQLGTPPTHCNFGNSWKSTVSAGFSGSYL